MEEPDRSHHHSRAGGELQDLGCKSITPLKMLPGSSALYEWMANRWLR